MKDNLKAILAAIMVLLGVGAIAGLFFATFPNAPAPLAGLFMAAVLLALAGAAFVVCSRKKGPLLTRQKDRISFDESAVTRTMPDGKTESVRWDDLKEVGILTTDEGPAVDDVFWLLLGERGGCAAPSEAIGMEELLPRLQKLPGFDNEAVIKAMGSTSNAKFVCWKRNPIEQK
jgi:hypothetical protein